MNEAARRRGRGPLGQALLVGALVVGAWLYLVGIFDPTLYRLRPTLQQTTGPSSTDLYSSWLPTREWLLHGRDPYSDPVTQEVQLGFYGRVLPAADPLYGTQAFVYPLYYMFFVAPVAALPFPVLRTTFYFVAVALLALMTVGWMLALGERVRPVPLALLALLGSSSLPGLQAVITQQPSLVVAALMAGAAACVAWGSRRPARSAPRWYGAAGVLLAVATVKPQVSGVLIAWLLLWAVGAWRTRGGLIVGFAGTLAALVGAAWVVQPGWIGTWRDVLTLYSQHALGQSLLQSWLPSALAPTVPVLLAGLGLLFAAYAWHTRQARPGDLAWNLALALGGVYAILLFPRLVVYNQIILYPAVLLILAQWGALRARGRAGRWLGIITLELVAWPWLAATGLALAWLAAGVLGGATAAAAVGKYWQLPWLTSTLTPIVLLVPLVVLAVGTLRPMVPVPTPEVSTHD